MDGQAGLHIKPREFQGISPFSPQRRYHLSRSKNAFTAVAGRKPQAATSSTTTSLRGIYTKDVASTSAKCGIYKPRCSIYSGIYMGRKPRKGKSSLYYSQRDGTHWISGGMGVGAGHMATAVEKNAYLSGG